jgi:hypothetical protein
MGLASSYNTGHLFYQAFLVRKYGNRNKYEIPTPQEAPSQATEFGAYQDHGFQLEVSDQNPQAGSPWAGKAENA